ncbi:hypothetical protein C3942_00425 [Solimonas fluminis]|uniref:Uncharacterized protein n=1 Tax=Solimonas fluminis TaxID=2086571 RepID=A0A2S5TKW0_9GAMM|nr:hypothetical protein C3942_00425 [Solimonas fluminis]
MSLLAGCGGDALARSAAAAGEAAALREPLSAVEALDYCDALGGRPQKIACFEQVARGEDPSGAALLR